MEVHVRRGNVDYFCKTEEQLKLFQSAGYQIVKEEAEAPAEVKPKRSKKKTN